MNRWLWTSVILTAVTLGGTMFLYAFGRDYLPDQVPVHWDIKGEADQYTARDRVLPYLLISPGVMAVITLLALVLPWLSPKPYDVNRFSRTYYYVFTLVTVLFAYIQVTILLATAGQGAIAVKMMIGGIFLFFAALGNVLGKVRRNFWMGVRTPWTIASEMVWNQTHRIAAWLYTAVGIVGLVAVLLGVNLIVVFAVFMICVMLPIPYSLYLYKKLEREGKLDVAVEEKASSEVHVP
jgi:uncharacterized membrane protein